MTLTTKRRSPAQGANRSRAASGSHEPPPGVAAGSRRRRTQLALLLLLAAIAGGGAVCYLQFVRRPAGPAQAGNSNPINGQRAYQYLQDVCQLGRRPSGSPGMQQQQAQLERHFQQLGGQVSRQSFDVRHPVDGSPVTMTNLIVQWHPKRKDRVLLCCHYDTRPFPDEDRREPKGRFIGANDGASGVAVLAELAHYMPQLPGPVGVDFVLFDGEEFIFDPNTSEGYFRGSTYFAQSYQANPPEHRYRCGVLLDMVGDKDLHLYYERNSMRPPRARQVCQEIWAVARRLGVREFVPRSRHEVRDDHLPLNKNGIPTCDIIDFDYPRPGSFQSYWHTVQDTPDKCSPESLAKVAWVVLEWLREQK